MDNKLAMHVFVQWLTSKNCLDAWLTNTLMHAHTDRRFLETLDYRDVIDSVFTWNMTKEGERFWMDISTEWREVYKIVEDNYANK